MTTSRGLLLLATLRLLSLLTGPNGRVHVSERKAN